jgi:hypothetical protein
VTANDLTTEQTMGATTSHSDAIPDNSQEFAKIVAKSSYSSFLKINTGFSGVGSKIAISLCQLPHHWGG